MKKKDGLKIKISVEHVWVGGCGCQRCFMWIDGNPILAYEEDVTR